MKHYLLQILIAIDQLICTLIGGWADESLSSYAYRLEVKGKIWGRIWRPVADWVFLKLFNDPDHCRKAYEAERDRAQLPPELRTIKL